MISLVSPEYDFGMFCNQMLGKDIMGVIDAATGEIWAAGKNHSERTTDRNFRKGSRGRLYCENLQRLIYMVMNGSVPADATPTFLSAVEPLVLQLLQKWEMGDLRRAFAPKPEQVLQQLGTLTDMLVVVVSRREVETQDLSPALSVLKRLTASPATAREFFERVDIAFHGYDRVPDELSEIVEVRNYVFRLDEEFPFWLFFLSKQHLGLQCLWYCLLPPSLTEAGRLSILPERINQLLTRRWFPAMNHICEYAGFSEREIEQLTGRVVTYITKGKLPLGQERSDP